MERNKAIYFWNNLIFLILLFGLSFMFFIIDFLDTSDERVISQQENYLKKQV